MTNSQFLVLFRVFLLRIVDLESLAAEGDPVKLLGQFTALFAAISLLFSLPLLVMSQSDPEFSRETAHFLIATTMLIVGLLSVLNWDAAVPDRIDALVLSPWPVPLANHLPRQAFGFYLTAWSCSACTQCLQRASMASLLRIVC